MGLHATVEFDFPLETPVLGLPIDYSEALDEFCSTFDSEATNWCPVRTGYLCSTISSDHDGEIVAECWADAEYAQYVEYGTWKMAAQPYFEPAIAVAMGVAYPIFAELYEEALDEEQEILQEMMQEESEEYEVMGGGGFLYMILAAIIIGLVRGFIEGLKEAISPNDRSSRDSLGGFYDIEIT